MPIKVLSATTVGDRMFSSIRLNDGAKTGPVSVNQIRGLFAAGRLASDSLLAESDDGSDAKPLHYYFDLDTWRPLGAKSRRQNAMRFRLAALFIVGTSIVGGVQLCGAHSGEGWLRYLALGLTALKILVYGSLFFGVGRSMALWLCGWSLLDAALEYSRAATGGSHVGPAAQALAAMAIAGMLFRARQHHRADLACFVVAVLAFAVESFIP